MSCYWAYSNIENTIKQRELVSRFTSLIHKPIFTNWIIFRIVATDLDPFLNHLFGNILNILQPVSGQNEYAIKALMRLSLVMQEKMEP